MWRLQLMGIYTVIMFSPISRFQGSLGGIHVFPCVCVHAALCKVSQRQGSPSNKQSALIIKEALLFSDAGTL